MKPLLITKQGTVVPVSPGCHVPRQASNGLACRTVR